MADHDANKKIPNADTDAPNPDASWGANQAAKSEMQKKQAKKQDVEDEEN